MYRLNRLMNIECLEQKCVLAADVGLADLCDSADTVQTADAAVISSAEQDAVGLALVELNGSEAVHFDETDGGDVIADELNRGAGPLGASSVSESVPGIVANQESDDESDDDDTDSDDDEEDETDDMDEEDSGENDVEEEEEEEEDDDSEDMDDEDDMEEDESDDTDVENSDDESDEEQDDTEEERDSEDEEDGESEDMDDDGTEGMDDESDDDDDDSEKDDVDDEEEDGNSSPQTLALGQSDESNAGAGSRTSSKFVQQVSSASDSADLDLLFATLGSGDEDDSVADSLPNSTHADAAPELLEAADQVFGMLGPEGLSLV